MTMSAVRTIGFIVIGVASAYVVVARYEHESVKAMVGARMTTVSITYQSERSSRISVEADVEAAVKR